MNYLTAILAICFLIGCKPDASQEQFYHATTGKNNAILALNIDKNQFYGTYKVQYADDIIDSGDVRGIVIGDTLRGRFNYISYGGSQAVKPFLLLKSGDTLKQGSGFVYTYMKIPYYLPKSVVFKASDFQFLPIKTATYKALDAKMK